jgi:hypothetical protein
MGFPSNVPPSSPALKIKSFLARHRCGQSMLPPQPPTVAQSAPLMSAPLVRATTVPLIIDDDDIDWEELGESVQDLLNQQHTLFTGVTSAPGSGTNPNVPPVATPVQVVVTPPVVIPSAATPPNVAIPAVSAVPSVSVVFPLSLWCSLSRLS